MVSSMPRISVCIATVRPTTIGAAIASIIRQTWSDWELIVVGQGKAEILKAAVNSVSRDPRIRYIHADRHGLSAARNTALRHSVGDIFASTDDDCEARQDWLAVLAACFAEQSDLGLVGGSLIAPPAAKGRGPSSCLSILPGEVLYDPVTTPPPGPDGFNWVGANFAVRKSVTDRVGRFDELLGEGGRFLSGEDSDYLHRLEALGVKMLSTPRSVVYHTYGRRYGLRPMVKYWHGQGTGRGAVVAKLTLRGEPRGPAELRSQIRGYPTQWLGRRRSGHGPRAGQRKPGRLISDSVRLPAFLRTYRRCLRDYWVDEEGLLRARSHVGESVGG